VAEGEDKAAVTYLSCQDNPEFVTKTEEAIKKSKVSGTRFGFSVGQLQPKDMDLVLKLMDLKIN